MHVLRAADRKASPWKNGGGVTREVCAWPPGAGFDDFRWRVSMAEVRADGPFSVFPGVDRVLAVLEGRLALDIEGRGTIELSAASAPAAFPGDAPTIGRLLAGPVTDLNVMSRRGAVRADLTRLQIRPCLTLAPTTGARLLVARGRLQVIAPQAVDLLTDDALLLTDADSPVTLQARDGATAWLAAFADVPRGR
jgi:environmental stress-induced protein Ves